LTTAGVVNGGANVVGGVVQREANDVLNVPQNGSPTDTGSMAVDFAAGVVGGAAGTKIAYVRYPLPNVRQELAIIANSSRRSLRPDRVQSFSQYANRQMIRNTTASSVAGTSVGNFITNLWFNITSSFSSQKPQISSTICYSGQPGCPVDSTTTQQ
jgi:hypothetical protein